MPGSSRRESALISAENERTHVRCYTVHGELQPQYWPGIGAVNRLREVGRVTPCAPSFALQKIVVAAVGAQRTARPTFQVHGKPDNFYV